MDWIDEVIDEFDEQFRPLWSASESCLEPLVDVSTTDDNVVVTVDLPCVASKDDISLSVTNNSLEVKAVLHRNMKWERWGTSQKHIAFNSFKTLIDLPVKVNTAKAKAKFTSGILTITLPRAQKKIGLKID
ncbi:MAG: Hsp20/alpha crystallin family protein [Thaumarchaeota archaeon]|nr:Hsp20/alpha crystallin family protein [Nitrososphaerota archaeon]MCL5316928.1 Hsp20/alpha crystallin family protein [Nitrososphaerota archaeon]